MNERAFLPARDEQFHLLRAHRQPLPANVAAHFIETCTQSNDLVIDPFVASDAIVRAVVERGRRIIAADSNPIVAWAARVQATLPHAREIQAAFLRLGDTRKEGETLRAAVEKLYASQCAQCGGAVTVDYFVWRALEPRVAGEKYVLAAKVYTCAQCGAQRAEANETDRQRARDAAPRGIAYHLLVQRLLADDLTNTPHLKRFLERYTPRNLNALAAVTQKLDAEFRDDAARNTLLALLLHALDVGSSLYAAPDALPTREIPNEFIERNIWQALEQAARGLRERATALRLATNAAQVLNSHRAAAFIGQGGARTLVENVVGGNAALILSSPARLDPTFWEMSFLWTRWLLGKNAAAPLEILLNQENQRWGWYGKALTNALSDVSKLAASDAQLVVAFPSGSHAMIEALMLAASPVFALQDFAFRPERGAADSTEWGALRGDYQAVWQRADVNPVSSNNNALATKIRATSLQAAREILAARNEPLAYSWLHHAALEKLARENVLAETLNAKFREGDNAFQFLRHRMEEGFKEGFIHDIDQWQAKERVVWMLREEGNEKQETKNEKREANWDFVTRMESATQEIFRLSEKISAMDFEDELLKRFGGLLTPEIELVEMCARAYADFVEGDWVARTEKIEEWLVRARRLVTQLGAHLDFQVIENVEPFDLIWRAEKIIPASARGGVQQEKISEDVYAFLFRPRVDFHELIALRAVPLHGLIVLPETQIEVTRERLRREPRWEKKLERAGWEFLRVPLIEMLLRENFATRPEFQLAWGLEPALAEGQEQLALFERE